jgi:hypothetical protein
MTEPQAIETPARVEVPVPGVTDNKLKVLNHFGKAVWVIPEDAPASLKNLAEDLISAYPDQVRHPTQKQADYVLGGIVKYPPEPLPVTFRRKVV